MDDGPAGRAPRGLLTAMEAAKRIADLEAKLAEEKKAQDANIKEIMRLANQVAPLLAGERTVHPMEYVETNRSWARMWIEQRTRAEKAEAEVERLTKHLGGAPPGVLPSPPCPRCGSSERVLVWCCSDCQWHFLPVVERGGRESGRAEGDTSGRATAPVRESPGTIATPKLAAADPAARKERAP